MAKGENIIPFSGSAKDQGLRAVSDHLGAPRSAAGEPEFFVPLGEPAYAVVLRLQGKFPRISVRKAAEGDTPPSS